MKYYIYFILILGVISCSETSNLDKALELAGDNRYELEKVLAYYSENDRDSLKYKATCFLIENMEGKCSRLYNFNEDAYEIFDKEKELNKHRRKEHRLEMIQKVDSLIKVKGSSFQTVYDIDVITSDYLIENINLAFKAWEKPWARHFNFNEFCEYVLPYRIDEEPLSDWRKVFSEKYAYIEDSLTNKADTKEAVLYLNDLVGIDFRVEDFLELPYVSVILLDKVRAGGCNQRYLLMISILRAMGIPAILDYAPSQNKSFKDHSWTVYIDSMHRYCPFDGGRPRRKLFDLDNLPHAFLDSLMIPLADGFGSHVFRYTYSNNKNSLGAKIENKFSIPPLFRTKNIRNVTSDYLFIQKERFKYSFSDEELTKDNLVYLSVFGYGDNIREADWGIVKNKEVNFSNVGTKTVYIISIYKYGKLIPISYPILLEDSMVETILIPNFDHKQKLKLTRKCDISLLMQGYANTMIDAVFEGSNDPDFKDSELLYKIGKAPSFLEEGEVNITDEYRYVRYYSPEKDIRVAELEFWGENKLKGEPISFVIKDSISESDPIKCLDGDIRTNFNALAGSWVGLDLSIPKQIKRVKFLPRNNFNVIEKDNEYELLYYDKGWQSLGIKKSSNQYIEFERAPSNALFLLKNQTQGKEERIFTYKDGKQVWW